MPADHPATAQVVGALSAPAPMDPRSIARRRFLQLAAATAGAAALPTLLAGGVGAASPIGPTDGILVLITMGGGNDGLDTVVPVADGTYQARRGSLALPPDRVLPLTADRGLHPNLVGLKRRWDAGQVAVIEGVGDPLVDLSHFTSMARWMSGHAAGVRPSGWLGRYVDGLDGGDDRFHAVHLGTSLPLHLHGQVRRAIALPTALSGALGADRSRGWRNRMFDAVDALAAGPTGLGRWGDAVAADASTALAVAQRVQPNYTPALPAGKLVTEMALCARLINADVGVRVLSVLYGDFDSHADQATMHGARMAELDAGIQAFFDQLNPSFADRTLVLTASEFGRRVAANGSGGTDHGTASSLLAVGAGVSGGLHGSLPPLARTDRHGNLTPTVDFRQVYATVLDRWLGADPSELLGASFAALPFLTSPGSAPVPRPPTPVVAAPGPVPPAPAAPRRRSGYWMVAASGAVHAFGDAVHLGDAPAGSGSAVDLEPTPSGGGYLVATASGRVHAFGDARHLGDCANPGTLRPGEALTSISATPSGAGYWLFTTRGRVFCYGDAQHHGDVSGVALNGSVLDSVATPTGRGYYLVAADGGVFAFGDAAFAGSMGGRPLNAPVRSLVPAGPDGGYWLVAADGGIFAFGGAPFYGSMGGRRLNKPVSGMVAFGAAGYLMVAEDGGTFAFGTARFHGSLGDRPSTSSVRSIAVLAG